MLTKKEVYRQVFHVFLGIILALMYYLEILSPLAMLLGIIIGLMISFLVKRIPLPLFSTFLKYFERNEYLNKFPGRGMIFYFIGILLVIQLFEKDIALAAIMVLAFGDAVSHLFGAKFGRIKNIFNGDSKKLLEGTLAGTLAGFFSALIFVPVPEAFLGSLAAMTAEVIKIDFNEHTLDDNLVVPLVAGTVMLLVRIFL